MKKVMICFDNPEHSGSAQYLGETIERYAPDIPLGFDYLYSTEHLAERVIGKEYSLVIVENSSFGNGSFHASLAAIEAIKKAEKNTPVVSFGDQLGGEKAQELGADDFIDSHTAGCFGQIAGVAERYLLNGLKGRLIKKYLSVGNNSSAKKYLIGVVVKAM